MNNNFDNGTNPVDGNPNPVPNNTNPITNNIVDPNVNVVPTNPTYVDNSMLNNNTSLATNVTPVVDNTIAGVENNVVVENKKEPNKLVTLFLVALAVVFGILAMNTDSIFFSSNGENIISVDNYEEDVTKYVKNKTENDVYNIEEISNNKIILVQNSKLDKNKQIHVITKDLQEKYGLSSKLKIYKYTSVKVITDNVDISYEEQVEQLTLKELEDSVGARIPQCYVEFKGKKVVQIILIDNTVITKYTE